MPASSPASTAARQPSKKWFWIRVSLLLAVLGIVVFYAWFDRSRRRERVQWERTLDVAFVVVRDGAVSDAALAALRAETGALESALAGQLARYRASPARPFSFTWYGPTDLNRPLPDAPGGSFRSVVVHAWQLRRFTGDVNARAGVPSRGFDSVVYLVLRPPSERGLVEGLSELGGRVGVAVAELDESTVALTLFVATHELLHTLGATDRYDASGRTSIPDGLAEPEKMPLFPQRYVEIMARSRPLDAEREVPPASLDELWVGRRTAAEIGWSSTP